MSDKNRPRLGMSGNTLFGLMGSAAEGQEWASLNTGNPGDLERRARLELEWARVDPDGMASPRASAAALDVHAALNTYEVAAGTPAGVEHVDPDMVRVVGANGRRLIARWDADGLWLGGCLIADRAHREVLAAFITREGESD